MRAEEFQKLNNLFIQKMLIYIISEYGSSNIYVFRKGWECRFFGTGSRAGKVRCIFIDCWFPQWVLSCAKRVQSRSSGVLSDGGGWESAQRAGPEDERGSRFGRGRGVGPGGRNPRRSGPGDQLKVRGFLFFSRISVAFPRSGKNPQNAWSRRHPPRKIFRVCVSGAPSARFLPSSPARCKVVATRTRSCTNYTFYCR